MKITYKDKSLVIFIITLLVILISIVKVSSYLFLKISSSDSNIEKIVNTGRDNWINVIKPFQKNDLEDRIILLNFWNYSCISCIKHLPQIKQLEEDFGNKLVVINVHSSKFKNEKRTSAVKKAVSKHQITSAVINDHDLKIWNSFEVENLPTIILISANGRIKEKYETEEDFKDLKKDVKKLVSRHKFRINRDQLPIMPEVFDDVGNILSFPSGITYATNFTFENHKNLPAIFIANSSKNNIIVSSLSGKIITKIGSGRLYFEDGDFNVSSFRNPSGLDFFENKLYVADSGNDAIREVNFEDRKVRTIIGLNRGGILKFKNNKKLAKNVDLSFPTDVKILNDEKDLKLIISNSGSNQILSYNFLNKEISILAGNGENLNKDGKYPNNSLSQTSAIDIYDGKIYFIDSGSSSLRVIEKDGEVKTLIGFKDKKFGFKDGKKETALMQNPLGLFVDGANIFIVDSFNHALRKYNLSSKELTTLVENKYGNNVGGKNETQFDEPSDVVSMLGKIYVVDSNNNRIIEVNKDNLSAKIIDIIPQLKLPTENFLEYLPNLEQAEKISLKNDTDIVLKIIIEDKWKINELAPSFINLLELTGKNEADLLTNYDWQEIIGKKLILPKLKNNKRYILQGVIYYCENKENSLCFIKSYEQQISINKESNKTELTIKLGH